MPQASLKQIEFNGKVYFSQQELACKGSGMLLLAAGFAEQLLALRLAYGKPMPCTSVCRSSAHNTKVGGAPNSYHICDTLRGCAAADIAITDSQERARFIALALELGWSIGVHKSFVHIDRRVDHGAKQLMFLY